MANPICPTDCSALLASVKFNDCAPTIVASEIKRIFIGKADADAFTDVAVATEWTTRLAETTGDLRELIVIGDKPAPASVVKDISNARKHIVGKDHTVNFTIDDVTPENYEFMRSTECGGKYKIWYETHGGFIYGGNEGINASIVMDDVLNRGLDEIETIAGVATWRDKFSPERAVSPIFVNSI